MDTTKYVEIAVGNVTNRNIICKEGEVLNFLKPNEELYVSYFSYDKEILEHMKINKTVKMFKGKQYLRNIIFDIDKGKLTEKVMLESVQYFILETLMNEWELGKEHIQPFFSGRGFHIHTSDFFGFKDGIKLSDTLTATLPERFSLADSIYNNNRLIRVNGSYNYKSQLYKIPLTIDEINNLSIKQIKEMATEPRIFEFNGLEKIVNQFTNEIGIIKKTQPKINKPIKDNSSGVVTCVQKMYNEGPTEGSRHINILRMTSTYRRHGVPREAIYAMLIDWAPQLEPQEVYNIVDNVFNNRYEYGCNDFVMKKYCSSKCIYFKGKNYTNDFISLNKVLKNMKLNQNNKTVTLNIQDLYPSATSPWTLRGGDFVLLYGYTGNGKTSILLNLAYKSNLNVKWWTLENTIELNARRLIQSIYNLNPNEATNMINTYSSDLVREGFELTSTAPSIESIQTMVAQNKPDMLVIDTLEDIDVPYKVGNDKDDVIAHGLKNIAQQYNIIIIGVRHMSQESSRNPWEMNVYSGKGATSLAQKADKVMALLGEPKERRKILKSLKSRDEENFILPLDFHYETYSFKEVNNVSNRIS